jgi:ADP-heptose:LPS heptosyltransferase
MNKIFLDRLKSLDGFLLIALLLPSLVLKPIALLIRRLFVDNEASKLQSKAIVRPGGMGDLILLTAAMRQLGLSPNDFFWIIEKRSSAWARHLNLRHLCYDEVRFAIDAFWHCDRHSLVVNSEQFFGLSSILSRWIKADNGKLIGFATNRGRWLYDDRLPYDALETHELDEFKSLLVKANQTRVDAKIQSSTHRDFAAQPFVAIGISGQDSESRSFNSDTYYQLYTKHGRSMPVRIVCARSDLDLAKNLSAKIVASGGLAEISDSSLEQAINWIQTSSLLITVDGGLTHIATYFGVPCTAVFTSGVYKKWSPVSKGSQIVRRRNLDCQPCARFGQVPPCPNSFTCKDQNFWEPSASI